MPSTKSKPVVHDDAHEPAHDDPETFEQPVVPERFCVKDEASANWAVKKIALARHYQKQVKEWAEKETRRAQHEEAFFLRRFENELSDWARSQVAKSKKKSVNLPAGTVGFRKCPAKLVVDDEVQVIRWAKKHCAEAVVVIERLSKTVLNDLLSQSGVVPDTGAHIEPEREQFFVR